MTKVEEGAKGGAGRSSWHSYLTFYKRKKLGVEN
jgi:hypothetical protein